MMTFLIALLAASAQIAPAGLVGEPAVSIAPPVLIPEDTPVELMALAEVTTATAQPGTLFKLRVNKPILVDGKIVVPVGTLAYGRVETATDAGGLGKSGRMTARLTNIQLGDAAIPLDGEMSAKGQGAGSAGVAVLFTGMMGLFHRGNDAKIKAGELVPAFVAAPTLIDLSGAKPRLVTAAVAASE